MTNTGQRCGRRGRPSPHQFRRAIPIAHLVTNYTTSGITPFCLLVHPRFSYRDSSRSRSRPFCSAVSRLLRPTSSPGLPRMRLPIYQTGQMAFSGSPFRSTLLRLFSRRLRYMHLGLRPYPGLLRVSGGKDSKNPPLLRMNFNASQNQRHHNLHIAASRAYVYTFELSATPTSLRRSGAESSSLRLRPLPYFYGLSSHRVWHTSNYHQLAAGGPYDRVFTLPPAFVLTRTHRHFLRCAVSWSPNPVPTVAGHFFATM